MNNEAVLLAISLGLGLLVGLQRQHADSGIAGIRTFPLITLTGSVCGLLSKSLNAWVLFGGFIAIASMLVIGNIQRIRSRQPGSGITTEVAALFMYVVGAYLVFGQPAIAVVLTGVTAVLLHFKLTLHGWVEKIGEQDGKAIMQFVLISMVILPILPNKTYDIYESLNPRDIWMMVVLIVGISLIGYFLYKLVGANAGVLLGGILGGMISSTATTASYAKTGARSGGESIALFVIVTASAVSLVRVIVEIAVVAPGSFRTFVVPLAAELLVLLIMTVILFFGHRKEKSKIPEQENPAQIKGALIFAGLYALISFITAAVKAEIGDSGLFVVSIISGLTDLDAITLSTARMAEQKNIDATLGWKLVLIAAMSNLVFKAGMVFVLGSRKLGLRVAIFFGIAIAAGFAILAFPSLFNFFEG